MFVRSEKPIQGVLSFMKSKFTMYFEAPGENTACISKFELKIHHVFRSSGLEISCIFNFQVVVYPVLLSPE